MSGGLLAPGAVAGTAIGTLTVTGNVRLRGQLDLFESVPTPPGRPAS